MVKWTLTIEMAVLFGQLEWHLYCKVLICYADFRRSGVMSMKISLLINSNSRDVFPPPVHRYIAIFELSAL